MDKEPYCCFELRLIRKYYSLLCKTFKSKKSLIKETLAQNENDGTTAPDTREIKVVRGLTEFRIPPKEIEQIESLHLPQPPEVESSYPIFRDLSENGKKHDLVGDFGYSHVITISNGNSVVKHAYSNDFKQEVIIKTLQRPIPDDEEDGLEVDTLLETELESLLKVNQKNILRMYEYHLSESELHIVMEYAKNGTLAELLLNVVKIPERFARKMFRGLCEALRYCHKKLIYHRNITSENIFVSRKMVLKLGNFLSMGNMSREIMEPIGSLQYYAPEVFVPCFIPGSYADMWSMGTVLYHMLFGTLPFNICEYSQIINDERALPSIDPPEKVTISKDALAVLNSLLCSFVDRLTLKQLINHTWFHTLTPSTATFESKSAAHIKDEQQILAENILKEITKCFVEAHKN